MLGLKLNHVSKRGHRSIMGVITHHVDNAVNVCNLISIKIGERLVNSAYKHIKTNKSMVEITKPTVPQFTQQDSMWCWKYKATINMILIYDIGLLHAMPTRPKYISWDNIWIHNCFAEGMIRMFDNDVWLLHLPILCGFAVVTVYVFSCRRTEYPYNTENGLIYN